MGKFFLATAYHVRIKRYTGRLMKVIRRTDNEKSAQLSFSVRAHRAVDDEAIIRDDGISIATEKGARSLRYSGKFVTRPR